MRKRLKNLINCLLIGGSIISSQLLGGELESKIFLEKTQNKKTIVYNREIMDNIKHYSFVKNNQIKVYETKGTEVTSQDKRYIKDLNNQDSYIENRINTYITIERNQNGNFYFEYKTGGRNDLSELERKRIPNSDEFFREDTKNTHIYFIYPPESQLEIISQNLEVLNNKTEKTRTINTKQFEETEFYEIISKVSDFFEIYNLIKPKIEEEENKDLDNWRVNNLGYNQESEEQLNKKAFFNQLPPENPQVKLAKKIPGKAGKIIKSSIFLSKVLMNEIERKNRLKFWKKGISEDWNVLQMPLYVGEEVNPFRDNIIKRKTNFRINGEYDKFHIMISSLPYITGTFRTQTSGIEDVLIEVKK
jgi:hypothetical protein